MSKEVVVTDSNFKMEVLGSNTPVLLDFWAEWCAPCRALAPVIEKIAEANSGKLKVGKLNVDENPGTAQQFGIQGIPTLILFKDGKAAHQLVGFQSQGNIQRAVDEILGQKK
jgi:thioredoxin 1